MPSARLKNLNTEKWHKISEAALQEFQEHGIHQASFNRIIRASGLSKGAVYYYFDSKEDLVQTMISRITHDLEPRLMSAHPLNHVKLNVIFVYESYSPSSRPSLWKFDILNGSL